MEAGSRLANAQERTQAPPRAGPASSRQWHAARTSMTRLSAYLLRLLARETLTMLALMLGLLFLVQCLKIFDVIVVQGQNLWTLVGQAALGMPPLAIVIAYVCMGIGMVRALGALQSSHELHIIHTNRQLGSLFGGIALFAIASAAVVLALSNFVEPWANRRLDDWSASIAADIVGRTLTPHRFSQVVSGVTIVIGGRRGTGDITDFFADDTRDPTMRRTYSAKTAKVGTDASGYVLEMHDGTLQYLSADNDFSQVSFKTYNIALDKLTQPDVSRNGLDERTTPELIAIASKGGGKWTGSTVHELIDRLSEGLRAISMCVFMAALTAFPHARRGRARFPLELIPLLVAYADKSITSSLGGPPGLLQLAGPLAVLVIGIVMLGYRLRLLRPVMRAARPA
jgi:lipopolysaccharide export system permease protein